MQLFVTPWTTRLLCSWDSSGKNTGVSCHFLLQGIFPIQESNPHLLPALAGGFFTTELPGNPITIDQIRSDQSLSRVWLFATPWIAARQASLSITNSRSSLRFTSIESVMPSRNKTIWWQRHGSNRRESYSGFMMSLHMQGLSSDLQHPLKSR